MKFNGKRALISIAATAVLAVGVPFLLVPYTPDSMRPVLQLALFACFMIVGAVGVFWSVEP